MIRLSRLSDYAVLLMTQVARTADDIHTAHDLSDSTHLPAPTVSKILATLARANLLESVRGRQGGYRLAQDSCDITVEDIIAAVDGPIALTQCVEQGPGMCDVEAFCPSSTHWHRINEAIRRALGEVTLAELTAPAPIAVPRERATMARSVATN
ncbi:MAG: SUF system Fe-S cluster assembly regulator [Alphaproteobacteria bacterium]|nr:SUF system Fe-S cluster assembly regulator [Alphaproteobacteria bacterium]